MAILYEVKERKNPQNPGAPGKYYPNVVRTQNITMNALAKEIAETNTLSRAEVTAVITLVLDHMTKHLKNSNGIRLGELGTLYPTLKGSGAPTAEEFNAGEHIDEVMVRFRAAKSLKQNMQNVEFKKVEFDAK